MRRSLYIAAALAAWLGLTPLVPVTARSWALGTPSPAAAADTASGPGAGAPRIPVGPDTDGDSWADIVEVFLGSDPGDPTSAPEHLSIPESCMNAVDDDLDGGVDEKDAGCRPDDVATVTFPAAGVDAFDSTMVLDGYELDTGTGICPIDFQGSGPTIVERAAPGDLGGGLRTVAIELVALQIEGTAVLLPGSSCNPGAAPVSFEAAILEDPAQDSVGTITDTNADPASDFPADSFFDVFFLVSTPFGLLPGGPPGGPAGAAVEITNSIRSIPPYHSPANPKANPNCYTVAGLPHQHCPKPPLDHFKCYTGTFSTFEGTATLEDQFLREDVKVRTPNRLCNPVSKNGQGIFDDGGHLERYGVAPLKGAPPLQPVTVVIQNQFGLQPMTVTGRKGLFVPSRKDKLASPLALDHFRCYAVQGREVGQKVKLEDQFDVADGRLERARVLKPVTLCNPVEKTHDGVTTPIGDASMHLVCYAIETQAFRARTVLVRNQFRRAKVRVLRPVELCAPSLKTVVPGIEVDEFPGVVAQIQIQTDQGSEVVDLTGSASVKAHPTELADADGDGLEEISTEIVQLNLTGTSNILGGVTIRVRDPADDPNQASTGVIEEVADETPGVLDLPPFAPTGQATSTLDLFMELEKTVNGVPIVIHNPVPIGLFGEITYKPCGPGDIYLSTSPVQLVDEQGQPVPIQILQFSLIPLPP